MKTAKSIQEAINEIRRNRAEYIQTLDDKIHLPYEEQILKHQKAICETRIADLTIALELAKEKEEILETLKMANEMLISKNGNLFKQWPESIEIEKVIKKNEP